MPKRGEKVSPLFDYVKKCRIGMMLPFWASAIF